jgi:hypothetical protein
MCEPPGRRRDARTTFPSRVASIAPCSLRSTHQLMILFESLFSVKPCQICIVQTKRIVCVIL